MGMGRPSIAIALAVAAFACGKTLEVDAPPAPDASASGDAGAEASAEAGPDAASCGSPRTRALRCGAATCDVSGDQACCVDGAKRACGSKNGGCAGTQMNCQGKADCPNDTTCCQTGSSVGSQCVQDASCGGRPRYCYTSDECPPGEGCFQLEPEDPDVWACTPCR